jgi:hypothetical protein
MTQEVPHVSQKQHINVCTTSAVVLWKTSGGRWNLVVTLWKTSGGIWKVAGKAKAMSPIVISSESEEI